MVLDFLFSRRFNWFDLIYILAAPMLFQQIGWWAVLVIIVGAIFSASSENRLKGN